MQVKIELPDELGNQLLEMPDMQLLVQKAVEKMLLEERQKQSSQLLVDLLNDLPEFPTFKNQDPLKLQRALRDEWD
ncbi:hypothetical protein AA650_23660 [Anabaena sp. WA102]|jgi:hypothetical protein|uniref:hypothetical protein n=1 Tax=Anabaena sp. WA102 TaxID=1647413 RepID=UPI0006AC3CBB|nr:hypothetical protein [Anabaena sp. WA102]ALB43051.1 hypothetical protein AA650_23660 [Anabaena sp. WA102]